MKKSKNKTSGELFAQAAVAAGLGMGLTLSLTALIAYLKAAGRAGDENGVWLLISVFLGACITAVYLRRVRLPFLPLALLSSVSYTLPLELLAFLHTKGTLSGSEVLINCAAAAAGSATGLVTIFGKSNKSYIIKSKRKRSITNSNQLY